MYIPGTIRDWESWTGMTFPQSGEYLVPGALQPVHMDVENDRGEYIEPNIWILHEVRESGAGDIAGKRAG